MIHEPDPKPNASRNIALVPPLGQRRSVVASCLVGLLATTLVHCVDADEPTRAPGGGYVQTFGDDGSAEAAACDEDGEVERCTAHHEAGCALGERTCVGGEWSACEPPANPVTNRNLTTDLPKACGDGGTIENSCDPECQAVEPNSPDLGAGASFDWMVGDLGDLPSGALSAGLPENCDEDRDCQLDHYCDETADGGNGECRAWNPGEGNPACGNDYDVVAGVPCENAVPICNRGNAPVPAAELAAMRIKWKAPPPYLMNGCSMTAPEGSCAIEATEALAVGQCVEVSCDIPRNRVVFVDAANGGSNECECANNWTFNMDGECGAPTCGSDINIAEEVKLTLFMSLDISGSMNFHRDCPYANACSGRCDADNCNGTCINATTCSSHVGDRDQCCWDAPTAATSRWGAVREALGEFVQDDESAGLGVAMKFWPEGECQATTCDAVDAFADSGTCGHSPCASGDALADECAAYVEDVCDTNGLEYCCGEAPQGTCAFSPCSTSASTLTAGCGGTGTPIRTATTATCGTKGFEGCCNGTTSSGGNWGLNKAPCTATSSMTCRSGSGATIACNSSAAANAPVTSLAYAAYQTAQTTPSCITSWTASCVTTFRTKFAANNGGRNPCGKSWDAGCVAKYVATSGSTPGSSCTYADWDAACVAAAVEEGALCESTACNRPSLPEDCTSAGDCPLVLSDASPDAAEDAILAKLQSVVPVGGTPSAVALEGAGDFCKEFQAAHPLERCAVVFVSDGQPSGCGNTSAVYAAASGASDDGVYTFAVGISGAGTTFMNTVASRGDTGSAIFISPDNTASSDFLAALEHIRNEFSCSYRLPAGTSLATIEVGWNNGGGDPAIVAVANAEACDDTPADAYRYYASGDDEITLCAATCGAVKALPGSSVEIVQGCGASAHAVTVSDTFSAGDACDAYPGTFPMWTIMPYRAEVQAGSSIAVRARTRVMSDDSWGDYVDVVTITEANEVSDLDRPASLAAALGDAAFAYDIDIEISTTVAGGAPDLDEYELHFTCEYTE